MIRTLLATLALLAAALPAAAQPYKETISLAAEVAAGKLPKIEQRLPEKPLVMKFEAPRKAGQQGGEMRTLIGRAREVRLLNTISYNRLVVYNDKYEFVPDLAESFEVQDERIFTFRLRKGHKWSDGAPFTAEDFRYFWEDIANNPEISPAGPPVDLLVDGEKPLVEFPDALTVRYSWKQRNPKFLPRIAGTSAFYLYRPAHYLKKYHAKYADPANLARLAAAEKRANWASLHNKIDNMVENDNPDLPTLDAWMMQTRPPAIRFVAVRNPFYHRVDSNGVQLPYLDRVVMAQADPKLIPAKAGAGEADVQFRTIAFSNFTFLKENEKRAGYRTLLWKTAKGSHFTLYPNLNANDKAWRTLLRDARFRLALSHAIDREAVNQSLFYGLALESNNTVLPESPLFRPMYQTRGIDFDLAAANKLLDELGLAKRGSDGIRLLPDGRPMEIIIETAGEVSEQIDILELIAETWLKAGIKMFPKPSQRDVLRNRIFSGEALMSVWSGLENGVPNAATTPSELAPTSQFQLQWPKWGQFYETKGQSGETPDMTEAKELLTLNEQWNDAADLGTRDRIWHRMLSIHMDQMYTLGVITGVFQPIVINKRMANVPDEGIYNWDPGALIGMYRPETFWMKP
jgi:peptide/nickel transport system substrate-binding protein